jgi:beta-galactosidase
MDEAVAWVSMEAAGVVYTFNKRSGWLDYIDVDGRQVTRNGYSLKTDFWRAPTDNDFGANSQRRMAVWRNPQLRTTSFKCSVEDGYGKISVEYEIESPNSQISLEYLISPDGQLEVKQTMKALDTETRHPDLFRFGMTMVMEGDYDRVEYYGRGPIENYSDRNSSQWIGLFRQTVAEQYYPYIRPQETGNKTDVRWWRVTDASGKGLEFTAPAPLSMSSLNYLTEDLDEGMAKRNLHAGDLTPRPFTVVHIDNAQYGLACVNSWGATPLEPYKIHYGDHSYSFVIRPIR